MDWLKFILIFAVFVVLTNSAFALNEKTTCSFVNPYSPVILEGYGLSDGFGFSTTSSDITHTCTDSYYSDYCYYNYDNGYGSGAGCYGTPTVVFNNSYFGSASCPIAYRAYANAYYNNLPNNRCYWIKTSVQTQSSNIYHEYFGVHNWYNPSEIELASWVSTYGSANQPITDIRHEYVYVGPGGTYANPVSGPNWYDYYSGTGGSSDDVEVLGAIYPNSCPTGATAFLWTNMTILSIPRQNLTGTYTCCRNAGIDPNEVLVLINGLSISKIQGSPTVLSKPANGILNVTVNWRDDGTDSGDYGAGMLRQLVLYPDPNNIAVYTVPCENVTINSSPNATQSCAGGICNVTASCLINVSSYSAGTFGIRALVRDSYLLTCFNAQHSQDITFYPNLQVVDIPSLVLNGPANGVSYANNSFVNFNYTATSKHDSTLNNTLIINAVTYFTGAESNGTAHNHSYQFTIGTYNWNVQAKDSYGTNTSETRTFTILNPSYPTISSVVVPAIQNVGANLVANATVVPGSFPISTVTYTMTPSGMGTSMINIGGNNWAVTGFGAIPSAWATNQNYNITACDSSGFCTSSTGTVQINHNPSFVSQVVNPTSPSTYNPTLTTVFNSTWTEDISLSVCTFSLDGTAYSATRVGNTCSYGVVGLSAGTHNYGWNVVDVGGLTNQTASYPNSYTYVVNKATPTITHSVSPSNSVASGTAVSGSCNVANNTGSTMTYNRCTLQTSASQTSPGTLTFGPVTPAIGTYTCNCSVASSTNWNYAQNIITLTVSGSTPPIVSNLKPVTGTIINTGTNYGFNVTAIAGSYPINYVAIILMNSAGTQAWNPAEWSNLYMTNLGGGLYQKYGILTDAMPNAMKAIVTAVDTNGVLGQAETYFTNNHAPTYSNLNVSPAMPVQYSPSRVYTFSANWVDDLFSVTNTNITIDGVTYTGVNVGGNLWQYNITGLSYGQHNYTWSAKDTYNATRTTPMQFYSVGQIAPIFTINIAPSVSVISGTQTNASCIADLNVTPQLWRNGVLMSNPDIQTLSAGQYTYLCNFTPTGNYSYSYTTDLLIVNSANAQTQSQFCGGQLDKTYTYNNGGENYTMCVNIPCGSNVTSATVNLTGLPLFGLLRRTIGFYNTTNNSIAGCNFYNYSGLINSSIYCNDTNFYMNGGRIELQNVRIYNSTFNYTIKNYSATFSNVYIGNAYYLNGKLIYGTVTTDTTYDGEVVGGVYNYWIRFDT